MTNNTHPVLADVIQLSTKQCEVPIRGHLKYATSENFVGRPINGYSADAIEVCLLAKRAAKALCDAQNQLVKQHDVGLIIYDAYRPLRAVKDFAKWFHEPPTGPYELERKAFHYPELGKDQLSQLGYVAAEVSRHCFGNAVDVTLIDLKTGYPLEMGAGYDFFGEISHTTTTADQIGELAFRNRQILAEAMVQAGYEIYKNEYWHFNFNEYETDQPLDVPITLALKGVV